MVSRFSTVRSRMAIRVSAGIVSPKISVSFSSGKRIPSSYKKPMASEVMLLQAEKVYFHTEVL